MLCHWEILESVINYIASIHISLNLKIVLKLKSLLLTLTFTLKLTTEEDKKEASTTNTMTSFFQYHSNFLDISQLLMQKLLLVGEVRVVPQIPQCNPYGRGYPWWYPIEDTICGHHMQCCIKRVINQQVDN